MKGGKKRDKLFSARFGGLNKLFAAKSLVYIIAESGGMI